MGLLFIATVAAGLFRHYSIPYTVLLVVIGLGLGELEHYWEALEVLQSFTLTPELVFFIFLPALIFESGLSLDARQLMKDLAPVLTLAVPALLLSTTIIGVVLWLLLGIDLTTALLFGALISATDPVAVIALFKELGAPLRLNVLVEGESLFNDATAIVVFSILLGMVLEGTEISLLSTSEAIIEFLVVFLGGAVLGSIIGLLISELVFRLKSNVSGILTMTMITAYASFILAEHVFHVSGVIATVCASLMLSIYGMTRIPVNVKPILTETWEFVGLVANSFLFLLVGLSIDISILSSHAGAIVITIVVVILARAATVYSLVPVTIDFFKLPRVSMAERHIMWWGGLKGGLAIAIVLSIPESLPGRELLISLTLGVVLFTLIVNAWSIRPLMHWLKLDQLTEDELSEFERELRHAGELSSEVISHYRELGILSEQLGRELDKEIRLSLENAAIQNDGSHSYRQVFLFGLKAEIDTLNQLYSTGVIDQYTLLDIRNALQLDRENFQQTNDDIKDADGKQSTTILHQMELKVLKFTREKNWAVPFLSHYQLQRLKQRIQRQIASIVMSCIVIERLQHENSFDEQDKKELIEKHKHRIAWRRQSLGKLREDYQDIFLAIEREMFTRAALISAKVGAEQEFHHGEIGIKAFNRISDVISKVLVHTMDNGRLSSYLHTALGAVSLFQGLTEDAIKALASHIQTVTFLVDDIIIGEGEKGDALYIIKKGRVSVTKMIDGQSQEIQQLGQSDFFGEVALLGDHVRTATVTALSTVVTLRLTRADVMAIANQYEEVRLRLAEVRDNRMK